MPKLKKIGRKALPQGTRLQDSFVGLQFQKAKIRFFRAKGNHFFAIVTGYIKQDFQVLIRKLDMSTLRFYQFASVQLSVRPSYVLLYAAKARSYAGTNGNSGRKSGFNLFRVFLNEAIALAKERGKKEIILVAANKKLEKYYETFGFDFDDFGNGTLIIEKKRN
jgi:hypothetical protein